MRSSVEVFARRWWGGELGAGGRVLSGLMMPLSWTWSAAATVAGALAERRSVDVDGVSVLSVGNLGVGGTGKTPITSWLGRRLEDEGQAVAIVVGAAGADERALHAGNLAQGAALQSRDRVAGAVEARERGASVVILDDGFQHRRLQRRLDVVLLAAEDPFPAPTVPCGPYREARRALGRADVIVVTRREASRDASGTLAEKLEQGAPGRVVAGARLIPAGWRRLDGETADLPHGDVLAVSGIARPLDFKAGVARLASGTVELVAFPDHHAYTRAEATLLAERSRGRPLAITEKDAVKLHHHADALPPTFVLQEKVSWDWGEEELLRRVRGAVKGPKVT